MSSDDHLAVLLARLDQLEAAKRRREQSIDHSIPIGSGLELMSLQEVAAALKLHPETVGQLCTLGGLPHVRVGDSILILPQELRRWLGGKSDVATLNP
jgi:excisionase family DNA binding protein